MNARHNGKSENTPSRMWKCEEGGEGQEAHTTQLTVKCRIGGRHGARKVGGGGRGGCMESNEPSPIRVCRLRGSGPCLLADKVNGKSVFHARSINTAPARRDKFL